MKYVQKVWGREDWIANTSLYCGKRNHLWVKHRVSDHHHRVKDETFFVLSGLMLLEINRGEEWERTVVLGPDDSIRLEPLMWHRYTGLKNTVFFEFSTHHDDKDTYRRTESEQVSDTEWEEILEKWREFL